MKEILYEMIPVMEFITKKELCERLHTDERTIRGLISEIRKEHNILSLSSQKGYMRLKPIDELTDDEKNMVESMLKRQLAEENSRIKKLKYSMKMQIAYMKMLQKSM